MKAPAKRDILILEKAVNVLERIYFNEKDPNAPHRYEDAIDGGVQPSTAQGSLWDVIAHCEKIRKEKGLA